MRYFLSIISSSILLLYFILFPINLQSAEFAITSVRFDRTAINTPTTGLVCVKPATNATESSVQVTFPPTFTVSSNTSLWTVSVANLPAGTSPWTGIGTATSASGQTVTFPSGDLNVGTLYCFNFTNSSALTTGGAGNTVGSITTFTSTPSVIDQSKYGVTLQNNDQVSLSASIPAIPSDIRLTQSTIPDDGTTLTSNDEVTVTLAYGSNIVAPEPFTLEAQWDQGLVDGSSSNYIDVFDYVPGSASHADDGTVPVIDLQNRKITWNIPSLSQSVTDHTVTYKLRIKPDITTNTRMTTAVRSIGQLGTTFSSEQKTNFYVLIPPPTATPTPTPTPVENENTPTPSSGSNAAGTPTPTPAQTPLQFVKIELRDVTDTSAQIYLQTTKNANYTLFYGTQPNALNTKITSLSAKSQQLINLDGLSPNTQYYLKIQIVNSDGQRATSDIYTFRTATQESLIKISKENVTVLWNGIVLNNSSTTRLLIPRSKPLTFIIHTDSPESISSLKASFQSSSVLGATSLNSPAPVGEVELIEINPGYYSGALQSPNVNSSYNLALKVQDIYGGFATNVVPFGFLITDPITIRSKTTHQPIENAQISISKLIQSSNTYYDLRQDFPLANTTNTKGEADLVLPAGQYRLSIDAEKYQGTQRDFEINNSSSSYPQIELSSDVTVVTQLSYFRQVLDTGFTFLQNSIKTLTTSTFLKDFTLITLVAGTVSSLLISLLLRGLAKNLDWLTWSVLTVILDFVVVSSILLTIVFIANNGVAQSSGFIVSTYFTIQIRFWDKVRLYIKTALKKRK